MVGKFGKFLVGKAAAAVHDGQQMLCSRQQPVKGLICTAAAVGDGGDLDNLCSFYAFTGYKIKGVSAEGSKSRDSQLVGNV